MAALAMACGGAGESHNSSQSGATERAGIAKADNQPKVTLTGCLQNADKPGTVGTAGSGGRGSAADAPDQFAAGKGSPGERFTLTDATTVSGPTDPSAGSYVLDGNLTALRENLNRQVRLTGILDASYANSPQRIRVDSVEALGEVCVVR
jgi:hypothetical protein